ncbi:Pentatricopeptide repeat-containing protein, chloroplastic [Symbiodinium microadriaticum]|uniref:Pentatricopeptide repeat-containing protein, chloroplastic n=1 Tax=Symbiodinium microadriaticum TaxID=2951 RepID=A0A1Q9DD59_SYMMI|nr:Pentatricopeptide repeat-containing protein, chloroplastic [Symbiodinium microadriaticum]
MRYASRISRLLKHRTVLIDHAGRARDWVGALCMLHEMDGARLLANLITFNANITACARSSQWQSSLALLLELRERKLEPDCTSYNSTITACERGSAMQMASEVLVQMHDAGVQADLYTYNASLSGHGKDAKWEIAMQLLVAMARRRTEPDVVSFGAALSACEKASQWLAAVQLLGTMRSTRLDPNVIIYSTSISACAKSSQWQCALHVLRELQAQFMRADVVAYSAAISACKKGAAWQSALELLQHMKQNGPEPNIIAYTASLNACERGSYWPLTLQLMQEVRGRSMEPTEITYGAAMTACSRGSLWQYALMVLDEMQVAAVSPDSLIFNACVGACRRGSQGRRLHVSRSIVMVGSALTPPARLTNELPVFQLAAKSLRPPLPSTMRTSMELRAATAKGPGGVAVKDSRGMSGTLMLVLTFIASAVANRVANRVLLVPMAGHTLFLSLATSTAQLTAYLLLLAWRAWKQLAISDMCQFVAAHWKLLLLVGTCEGAFYPLVFAAAAKLPGGLVQVLNQSVVPYTVAFSVFLLGRRYTPVQLVGVATVLLGVLVAVGLPAGSLWSHQVVMHDVLQCAGAYALLALAVTLKDRIFRNARETATTAVEDPNADVL